MTSETETPVAAAPLPEAWVAYIAPFAEVLGISVEEASVKLEPMVGSPSERAIVLLKDPAMSPDGELKIALAGTPSAVANQAISLLREAVVAHTPFAYAGADFLPEVPSDESWFSSLRAGGVLKVEQSTVVSAVKAALAHRIGFFNIPNLLVDKMESFADSNADPVPAEYFKLRKQITRREYAEIFEAVSGLDGSFVTDKRRSELFKRIDVIFWPSIVSFHAQLKSWMDTWQQSASNPAMMMSALARISGVGGGMPPGMMEPPDTGVLRDQAEAFNDDLNKIFAGTVAPVASALALDAKRIKDTLENPSLPSMIGAANREQMLRQLDIDVSANFPRLETNLTRYVLSVMSVRDLPAGNEENQFFWSLYTLGAQIPWDQLSAKRPVRRGE